jgi:hypothetical protein
MHRRQAFTNLQENNNDMGQAKQIFSLCSAEERIYSMAAEEALNSFFLSSQARQDRLTDIFSQLRFQVVRMPGAESQASGDYSPACLAVLELLEKAEELTRK